MIKRIYFSNTLIVFASFSVFLAALIFQSAIVWAQESKSSESGSPKPNIVIILADDMGYGDVSWNNPHARTRTPHIDELVARSEEHTSELQSLMRISYAVFCLKKKTKNNNR